jgi:hypothetical protein
VRISRMRKRRPSSSSNVSPTVQFGTAVTKPAGSCAVPETAGRNAA